ncbi:LysR family transcriptional regulator [Tunturibacter empetritectus]|uniref:LysR family transcriptional regulator n=1 Tax=Tunturiibacter empetritectus TaxID=3069691 RepID=UPI00160B0EEE
MKNDLGELSAFATVAEERSFTRATARLGISQSALSHSIRGLEKRLGLQLLARTTRSVSPTAAGTTLLRELTPALERIERALANTRKQKETPSGRIRLVIPRTATKAMILPRLAQFGSSPERMVPIIPGIFPLLSQSSESTCCVCRAY